jgi:hypothetical protein
VNRGIAQRIPALSQAKAGNKVVPRRDEEVSGGADLESVRTWQRCGAAMVDCRSVEMVLGG